MLENWNNCHSYTLIFNKKLVTHLNYFAKIVKMSHIQLKVKKNHQAKDLLIQIIKVLNILPHQQY